MPHPTPPTDPYHHDPHPFGGDVELDLVPGDPPVPITVWRTPVAEAQAGMSPRLAARLLSAFTRPGQAVHDATGDPTLAQAVAALGRHSAAGHRGQPPEPAELALSAWPPPGRGIDPVISLGALRRRLAPGGVLVVVLADPAPGRQPVDAGPLVRAAAQARLAYLQHIVAVHAPIHADRIHPTLGDTVARRVGGGRHLRVHTDLLIFTPAGGRHG
jgi:hypothetical protein